MASREEMKERELPFDYMTKSERRKYDVAFSEWLKAFNARPMDTSEMRLQAWRMKTAHREAKERRAR